MAKVTLARPSKVNFRLSRKEILAQLFDGKTNRHPRNKQFSNYVARRVHREIMTPLVEAPYRALLTEGLPAYAAFQAKGTSDLSGPFNEISGVSVAHPVWPALSKRHLRRKKLERRSLNFRTYKGGLNRYLNSLFKISLGPKARVMRSAPLSTKYRPKKNYIEINTSYILLKKVRDQQVHDFLAHSFVSGEIDYTLLGKSKSSSFDKQKLRFFESGFSSSRSTTGRFTQRPLLGHIARTYGNKLRSKNLRRN